LSPVARGHLNDWRCVYVTLGANVMQQLHGVRREMNTSSPLSHQGVRGEKSAPTTPEVGTDFDMQYLLQRFPPYRVILYNDDVHSTDEVVAALCKSVPSLSQRKAILIMLQAHVTGRATVVICAREQAEYYAERLGTFGLTVTIEAAE
jgi:ATP-dependent Clp protease adapter protein ClpS